VPSAPGPSRSQRPYDALPVTRTTWGEWKRLYPDTDVYAGEPGR
jgi:hypothetical protein